MATGSGGSLGEALVAALAAAAGGDRAGRYRSYTATGWHAQISKLTSSPRGYQAAESAGLSVTHRTLVDWLAERVEPNAENRAKIAAAYRVMSNPWPSDVERQEFAISGVVQIGRDIRTRGTAEHAPLVIDGSQGRWADMRDAWESGDFPPDVVEEDFIENVIEEDLGEGSEPWEFPGTSYTVVIS
ncbi:hypothetical protein ACWC9H_35445 [Streptomyces sp. NPDC001251]